ncbi:TPA: hypothetical protein DCZ39_07780 [Patescibacteria group bacterium]|nr:hypothetical protein [Candidatus Gracilibacteria bacterium]
MYMCYLDISILEVEPVPNQEFSLFIESHGFTNKDINQNIKVSTSQIIANGTARLFTFSNFLCSVYLTNITFFNSSTFLSIHFLSVFQI